MTFLCGWETQTLCSANCGALFPQMLCLPLNDTVQMHPTCSPAPQGGNIVHQQHSLQRSVSLCRFFLLAVNLIVCLSWRRLPLSISLLPPFHSNIINTFHSCQSKKLKLTYIKALHPSYISRSRMGRGGRAEINVPECFC